MLLCRFVFFCYFGFGMKKIETSWGWKFLSSSKAIQGKIILEITFFTTTKIPSHLPSSMLVHTCGLLCSLCHLVKHQQNQNLYMTKCSCSIKPSYFSQKRYLKATRPTCFPFWGWGAPVGLCKHLCMYVSVCICEFPYGTSFPLLATQETLFSDLGFFFRFDVQEVLGGDWNPILAWGFKSSLYQHFNPFLEKDGSEKKHF